jgi:hypothetical protein
MVRPFGVAIGVANKEVIQNNVHLHGKKKVEFFFVHFSTGNQYTFYRISYLILS